MSFMNSDRKSNFPRRCVVLISLILLRGQTFVSAAEFHSFTPANVAALSPYNLHQPIIVFTALSGNGRIIAGQIIETGIDYDCARNNCGVVPFLWSSDNPSERRVVTTETPLNFPTHTRNAAAFRINALSQDGGASLLVSEYRRYETAIEHNGAVQLLRPVISSSGWLWATGISADASAVVGDVGGQPFRWDAANGLQPIPELPDTHPFSAAGISSDGNVVVLNAQAGATQGSSNLNVNSSRGNAYVWTATNGIDELPQLPGDTYSNAIDSSRNGTTIVGNSIIIGDQNVFQSRAVRWNDHVPTLLSNLPGYDASIVHALSADGRVVVGSTYNHSPALWQLPWIEAGMSGNLDGNSQGALSCFQAVLWDADGNVFNLKDMLISRFGLAEQLEGWTLTEASGISDDGTIIVGSGINPQGVQAIWIASLTVPEPSTAGSFAVVFAVITNCIRVSRRR